jgi:endonuclease YncB( thermonuclease family)
MAKVIESTKPASLTALKLQTYSSLKSAVQKAIALGKQRAFDAVERERVQTHWEVGKLILEHVLLHQSRAKYGAQVMGKLALDLGVSQRNLEYMVEFARAYPIANPRSQLSWSHFRVLLGVPNEGVREQFSKKSEKENWSLKKLRSEIKKEKASDKKTSSVLKNAEALAEPTLSPAGVYRQMTWRGRKVYDLGFTTYFEIKNKTKKSKPPKESELYFYQGVVDRVIDGDTVWVDVHLGFGIWSYQKLRLASIDAPEAISEAGQKAKRFLKSKIPHGAEVILKTTKSDKFDRYLADIWFEKKHINTLLIASGHAQSV